MKVFYSSLLKALNYMYVRLVYFSHPVFFFPDSLASFNVTFSELVVLLQVGPWVALVFFIFLWNYYQKDCSTGSSTTGGEQLEVTGQEFKSSSCSNHSNFKLFSLSWVLLLLLLIAKLIEILNSIIDDNWCWRYYKHQQELY